MNDRIGAMKTEKINSFTQLLMFLLLLPFDWCFAAISVHLTIHFYWQLDLSLFLIYVESDVGRGKKFKFVTTILFTLPRWISQNRIDRLSTRCVWEFFNLETFFYPHYFVWYAMEMCRDDENDISETRIDNHKSYNSKKLKCAHSKWMKKSTETRRSW